MDKYTEEFYSFNFGVSEFASVDVTQPSPKPVKAVSCFFVVCVCVCVCPWHACMQAQGLTSALSIS